MARCDVTGDRLHLARDLAAGKPPASEFRHVPGAKPGETTGFGDRRLERQLRRETVLDIARARHRSGLVVDEDETAIGAPSEAVGLAYELEGAGRTCEDEPTAELAAPR